MLDDYLPEKSAPDETTGFAELEGKVHIGIVASRYNEAYVQAMVKHAMEEIERLCPEAKVDEYNVPGAFEIPVVVNEMLHSLSRRYHCIIALGVIIKGSTAHADLIAQAITPALMSISLQTRVPVINEVLLVENEEQARERTMGEKINRGTEAARAALEVIATMRQV